MIHHTWTGKYEILSLSSKDNTYLRWLPCKIDNNHVNLVLQNTTKFPIYLHTDCRFELLRNYGLYIPSGGTLDLSRISPEFIYSLYIAVACE